LDQKRKEKNKKWPWGDGGDKGTIGELLGCTFAVRDVGRGWLNEGKKAYPPKRVGPGQVIARNSTGTDTGLGER